MVFQLEMLDRGLSFHFERVGSVIQLNRTRFVDGYVNVL